MQSSVLRLRVFLDQLRLPHHQPFGLLIRVVNARRQIGYAYPFRLFLAPILQGLLHRIYAEPGRPQVKSRARENEGRGAFWIGFHEIGKKERLDRLFANSVTKATDGNVLGLGRDVVSQVASPPFGVLDVRHRLEVDEAGFPREPDKLGFHHARWGVKNPLEGERKPQNDHMVMGPVLLFAMLREVEDLRDRQATITAGLLEVFNPAPDVTNAKAFL